jgi:hypothetical protein
MPGRPSGMRIPHQISVESSINIEQNGVESDRPKFSKARAVHNCFHPDSGIPRADRGFEENLV